MPIEARHCFRLALATALAVTGGFGAGIDMPYLAPLFTVLLGAAGAPPLGLTKVIPLTCVVAVVLGTGVWLAPLVVGFPMAGLLLVAVGVAISAWFTMGSANAAVGSLLAAGITLVSGFGVVSLALAQSLVSSMAVAFAMAMVAYWIAYQCFPDPHAGLPVSTDEPAESRDVHVLRSVALVMPAYLFLLVNPLGHAPVMLKTVALSTSNNTQDARLAARDLLSATALAGILGVAVWIVLRLSPTLWMLVLWCSLIMLFIGRHLYLHHGSKDVSSFWRDVGVTFFLILGPALADTSVGKDPYQAFAFRFAMLFGAAMYAVVVSFVLESLFSHKPSVSGAQTQ